MSSKTSNDSQNIISKFLTLPIVLGVLLIGSGILGITISTRSTSQLNKINDSALGPTLAFSEIVLHLDDLNQNILRLNQKSVTSEAEKSIIKKLQSITKKIDRKIKTQVELSQKQVYEQYLSLWYKDWENFHSTLESTLVSSELIKKNITLLDTSISGLVEKMGNINSFIQSDVKDMLDQSTLFSKNATRALMVVLLLGTLIGTFSSLVILKSIKRLVTTIVENKKNIEILLNNLDQGFLVFDRDGKILEGVSTAAKTFLGLDPTSKKFGEILPDEQQNTIAKKWIDLVYSGMMPFVDIKPLAPKSFEKNDRYVELDFRPIFSEHNQQELQRIICIASDKTEERRLRIQAEKEEAFVKLVMRALSDKSNFIDFVLETQKMIRGVDHELGKNHPDADTLFRLLHSIKGGTSAFSMIQVSRIAHHFETELASAKSGDPQEYKKAIVQLKAGMNDLKNQFNVYMEEYKQLFGPIDESSRDKNVPLRAIYDTYVKMVEELGAHSSSVRYFVDRFVLDQIETPFKRYETVVKNIADAQCKQVQFKIEPTSLKAFVDPYLPLVSTYIHVFRNAVDHGIEDTYSRVQVNKPETGTVNVSFARKENRLIIQVKDDGKGVDTKVVRQKALEKNLMSESSLSKLSDFEVIQLLFHSGFSTRDQVSELSGRGVGLDALKHEAEKLGGRAWMESENGKGSKIIVDVPYYDSPIFETTPIKKAA